MISWRFFLRLLNMSQLACGGGQDLSGLSSQKNSVKVIYFLSYVIESIYKLFEQCKVKDVIFWLVSFNRILILNKLPAKLFVLLRFVSCSFHLSVGLLLTPPLKNQQFWYFCWFSQEGFEFFFLILKTRVFCLLSVNNN